MFPGGMCYPLTPTDKHGEVQDCDQMIVILEKLAKLNELDLAFISRSRTKSYVAKILSTIEHQKNKGCTKTVSPIRDQFAAVKE